MPMVTECLEILHVLCKIKTWIKEVAGVVITEGRAIV